jgi:hypothetical protein
MAKNKKKKLTYRQKREDSKPVGFVETEHGSHPVGEHPARSTSTRTPRELEVVVWTHIVGTHLFTSSIVWSGTIMKEAKKAAEEHLAEEAWKFCCKVFESGMANEIPENLEADQLNFRITVCSKMDLALEARGKAPRIYYSCGNSSIKAISRVNLS